MQKSVDEKIQLITKLETQKAHLCRQIGEKNTRLQESNEKIKQLENTVLFLVT